MPPIYAIYLLLFLGAACVTLWAYDRVDAFRQERRRNTAHLISLWNVLVDYRKEMPEEPQPMDEALLHLQVVLTSYGVAPPKEPCPCPECSPDKLEADD